MKQHISCYKQDPPTKNRQGRPWRLMYFRRTLSPLSAYRPEYRPILPSPPGEPSARESIPEQRTKKNAPAISDTADPGANLCSGNNCAPCPLAPQIQLSRKLWLKSWQNRFASDTDPTAKSHRAEAMAHLNCSSTNHFLSLREQFLERPSACGEWTAGRGKLQWPGPPQ